MAKKFADHLNKAKVDHEIKIEYRMLTIFPFFPQTDLGQQGGQISGAVSHLMQEKMSVATGDRGQAAAVWRMRGTACQSGVLRTQTRRRAPSIHQGRFCHSR